MFLYFLVFDSLGLVDHTPLALFGLLPLLQTIFAIMKFLCLPLVLLQDCNIIMVVYRLCLVILTRKIGQRLIFWAKWRRLRLRLTPDFRSIFTAETHFISSGSSSKIFSRTECPSNNDFRIEIDYSSIILWIIFLLAGLNQNILELLFFRLFFLLLLLLAKLRLAC